MAKLIGNAPNQVPTNGDLGSMAFEDKKNYATTSSPIYQPYRNIIINGDMSIAQRGTTATGLGNGDTGYYTVDRWQFGEDVGSPTYEFTMSQETDVPTGQGFAKSLKMDCTTAQGSLVGYDSCHIRTIIEGQNLQYLKKGTANALSTTLSFWVKTNKTGTYIAELFDNDNARQISKAYTVNVANTWEKKTITFEGDTTGAFGNDNGASLYLVFWLAAGSSFSSGTLSTTWTSNTNANRAVGQVNLADSTANEWYITGVQLEAGTTASDFEFLPFDVNLQRCLRYFERYDNTINGVAGVPQGISVVDSTNRAETNLFYTRKRANPTITGSSDVSVTTMANTILTATSGPFTYVGTGLYGANLYYFVASGVSTNSLSGINYIALPSGKYINIDAEL